MLDEVLMQNKGRDESFGDSERRFPDPNDRAIAEYESAFSFRMRERNGWHIRKIEESLERLEDGTYGICEECEEEISEGRLEARPVTTLCIDCKRVQEENE